MTHILGHDRSQLLLLPEAVDDYVSADNPVRFIEAFVDELNLAALGFIGTEPGKWSGDPVDWFSGQPAESRVAVVLPTHPCHPNADQGYVVTLPDCRSARTTVDPDRALESEILSLLSSADIERDLHEVRIHITRTIPWSQYADQIWKSHGVYEHRGSCTQAAASLTPVGFVGWSSGAVLDGSNRSSTGGRAYTRRITGILGIWPFLALPMTSAITTYRNTAGRTPPGRQRPRGKLAKRNLA